METVDRIRELCKKKNISITKLEAALGYGNGSISKASTNAMRSDRLKAIADYFDVSMEFLLTGKDPEAFWDGPSDAPALTVEELRILELYRSLPADKQAEVLRYGKFLYTEAREERKKSSTSLREA